MNLGSGFWMLLAYSLFQDPRRIPRWIIAAFAVQALLSTVNAFGYVGSRQQRSAIGRVPGHRQHRFRAVAARDAVRVRGARALLGFARLASGSRRKLSACCAACSWPSSVGFRSGSTSRSSMPRRRGLPGACTGRQRHHARHGGGLRHRRARRAAIRRSRSRANLRANVLPRPNPKTNLSCRTRVRRARSGSARGEGVPHARPLDRCPRETTGRARIPAACVDQRAARLPKLQRLAARVPAARCVRSARRPGEGALADPHHRARRRLSVDCAVQPGVPRHTRVHSVRVSAQALEDRLNAYKPFLFPEIRAVLRESGRICEMHDAGSPPTRFSWSARCLLSFARCLPSRSRPPSQPRQAQTAGWPVTEGAPGGGRYSPLADIHAGNVGELEQAWVYRYGESDSFDAVLPMFNGTSSETTPILVDGRLIFTTPTNGVIALDPEQGAELWTFDPGVDRNGVVRHVDQPRRCRVARKRRRCVCAASVSHHSRRAADRVGRTNRRALPGLRGRQSPRRRATTRPAARIHSHISRNGGRRLDRRRLFRSRSDPRQRSARRGACVRRAQRRAPLDLPHHPRRG